MSGVGSSSSLLVPLDSEEKSVGSALGLLTRFEESGVRLEALGGRLHYSGPREALEADALAVMKAAKGELLLILLERQRVQAIDTFAERVALAEADGRLSLAEAEAQVRGELLAALGFIETERCILRKDPWGPEDLVELVQLRGLVKGEVVEVPTSERITDAGGGEGTQGLEEATR